MNKTIATIGILLGATGVASVDAVKLKEVPLQKDITVASEQVKVRQVGNVVETDMPWKGEKGLKIKYDMGEPTIEEKIKDKRDKQVVTEIVGEGFKIDIILDKKPKDNTFCYTIDGWEDYDFFYQPALTQEEIDEGYNRPEEIVGSYAVYHKQLKNHVTGQTNYETGKAFHVPFPYIWELGDESTKQRAEDLIYTDGQLCVVVQQDFLDKAKYPVRIDPTFGYTTVGGSIIGWTEDELWGYVFTSPSDTTTATDIKFYARYYTDSAEQMRAVLVTESDLNIVPNGVGSGVTLPASADWNTSTFSTNPTIIPSTDYVLMAMADINGSDWYYDSVGIGSKEILDASNSFSSPTNPTDAITGTGDIYSIYVTYIASGEPATETPKQSEYWFD